MFENSSKKLLSDVPGDSLNTEERTLKGQAKMFQTVEEALAFVGDENKYQWLIFVFFSIQWVMATIVLISGPFLFRVPTFTCNGKECTEDNGGCENGVVSSDPTSSIATTFGLYCDQKHMRTFVVSAVYLGSLAGLVVYSLISMSRKFYMISAWIIICVGLLILPFSTNTTMLTIFWFIIGFGVNPGIMIHITILDEQCGDKLRQYFSIGLFVVWALSEMYMTLIIYLVPNWKYFVWFFLCLPAVITTLMSPLIQESPKYMYIFNKEKTVKILNKIANINGKPPINSVDDLKDYQIQDTASLNKKYTVLDLFRYKSIRIPCILMSLSYTVQQLVYYGTVYSVPDIGVNIYLNTIISAIAELLGYLFAVYFSVRLKRRISIVITLFLTSGFCIIFYFLVIPSDCSEVCTMKIIQLLFSMFARFMVCFCLSILYCYMPEIYPTPVRSVGIGFTSVLGTIGTMMAPYMIDISKIIGLNPMVLIGLIGIGGSFLSLFMTETKDNRAGEEIQELLVNEKDFSNKETTEEEVSIIHDKPVD